MSTTPFVRPDASTVVGRAIGEGWKRMVHLLFKGPDARLRTWIGWGLLTLLAGVVGIGGGGPNFNGGNFGDHAHREFDFTPPDVGPGLVAAIVAGVVLLLALGIVWLYFQARFRGVFLDGVVSGRPQIRGVFARSKALGRPYFLFLLGMRIGLLLVIGAFVLAILGAVGGSLNADHFPAAAIGMILLAVVVLLPIAILWALVDAFAHHLVVPYVWLRGERFGQAFRSAWELVKANRGATALYTVACIGLSIGAHLAAMLAFCCLCIVWCLPAAGLVGLFMLTIKFQVTAIITFPLGAVLAFALAWIGATITCPVPVFFRAASLVFLTTLDPTLMPPAASATPDETVIAPPAPEVPPVPPVPPPPENL